MSEQHQPRGKKILGTGALVLGLCLLALAIPADWLARIGDLFDTDQPTQTAFSDDVVRADSSLAKGGEADAPDEPYVLARRLTRAGPMTKGEVERAVTLWRKWSEEPDVAQRLAKEFPRLDEAKIAEEVKRFRAQTEPPGSSPTESCMRCHRQTIELPGVARFDVAGIYPHGREVAEFAGGRRVPFLSEAIELEATAARGEKQSCGDCHVGHDEPGFEIDRTERIDNMGLWVTTESSDPNVLHIRVKVQNNRSGHLAPAGPGSPAYVIVAEARQRRKPLTLRFGPRLPSQLRSKGTAGEVFTRDFRDAHGKRTTDPKQIAMLVADTRLESGRFEQLDFVFDRADRSTAHIEVTLWHLPDVTTWKGAKAIRRADKPES